MDRQRVVDAYYAALRSEIELDAVPMDEGLAFASPMMNLDSAAAFRGALGGLTQRVKGLEIRHQAWDGSTAVTVYDFDLGLPDGPVPMAEAVTVADGAVQRVELLFDKARLAP